MSEENFNETAVADVVPVKNKTNLVLTVLNIILFIGLIVLYFIILKPDNGDNNASASAQHKAARSTNIVYVNSDSLMVHYDLVKTMRSDLEAKSRLLEQELSRKQSAFEKDANYFQDQVKKKSISEASAQEIYSSLMAEQQKLYDLRDQYAGEISRNEYELNLVLIDSLNNFLERYNQKYHYDYILSYAHGGNLLATNDSLDITHDVLNKLNKEYSMKAKKD
jgi:outer membrane protein